MGLELLQQNAKLLYNTSLVAQLVALGFLFLSSPYYASVGATAALLFGVLAVYGLVVQDGSDVRAVFGELSLRSRLFIGLAVVIIVGSMGAVVGQLSSNPSVGFFLTSYSRIALATGATSLLLYADYRQLEQTDDEPSAEALGPTEVEKMDWDDEVEE